MKHWAWVLAVVTYVFLVTAAITRLELSGLWGVVSGLIVLVPVAFLAGWNRLRWGIGLAVYLLLNIEMLIVSTVGTPGESLFDGASERAWYTPVIYVALFSTVGCLINAVPTIIAYGFGYQFSNGEKRHQ